MITRNRPWSDGNVAKVAIDSLKDPKVREIFNEVGTNSSLDDKTADGLIEVGERRAEAVDRS
jgi:hypothetical protein